MMGFTKKIMSESLNPDQTALLAFFKAHPGPQQVNAMKAIYRKSQKYEIDGERRARNALRRLVGDGYVELIARGVYQLVEKREGKPAKPARASAAAPVAKTDAAG